MSNSIKVNGAWTPVSRPYIKKNDVWIPAKETYVRAAGVYNSAWQYDTTPPPAPELTLDLTDKRYLKVGVRVVSESHDPTLRRIRVLISTRKQPATYNGIGKVTEKDNNWSYEEWNDWWYNGANGVNTAKQNRDHGNSNIVDYKEYPPNPSKSDHLEYNTDYYVSAWAEDLEQNWSVGTFQKFHMPKEGGDFKKIPTLKAATFLPTDMGTLDASGNFVSGQGVVNSAPATDLIWFYGDQITAAVGKDGDPTITTAGIRIARTNDTGEPEATVNLFWSDLGVPGVVGPDHIKGATTLGSTISKGRTATLGVPNSIQNHLNTDIKALGVQHTANTGAAMVVASLADSPRCGELSLTWSEQ